jgi:putative flippase GtrA
MGMRERRTQGARIAALFARLRTHPRSAQRVPAAGVSRFSSLFSRDRASGQALRFVVVGLTNTIVDLGIYTLLARVFHVPDIAAKATSYILGIGNSFIWNKYWTFSARHSGRGWREFGFFFLVNLPPLIVNVVVFSALSLGFKSPSFLVREGEAFAAAIIAVVWNFLGSRYLAFRHTALKKDSVAETKDAENAVKKPPMKKEEHA